MSEFISPQRIRFCLLMVLFSLPVFAQTTGKLGQTSLYEKDITLMGEDRKGPYFLPDSLILANSESIYINGELLPPIAYEMDYIDGEVRFKNSISKSFAIRLKYKVLYVPLLKSYYHRQIKQRVFNAPTGPSDRHKVSLEQEEEEEYAANLTKSGSITRGVTMGNNRGLKVNSSLNINVNGKVADNVEVVASLTDQTTPIQPEGTTQNLQEIDKVFVQIKAPHLSATMGDFQLNYSGTQFAGYSRKLQGAMGKAESEDFQISVSGAVSRGTYTTMQFNGQESYQGPYQLKGDLGQIDIIILAGTERVYIDGEQMVRGETNDYIIDYAAAQITFTRKRLITSDSRVTIDFQYSDEKFRRNLYSAEGKAQFLDGRISLTTTFLREADDKNNPLDFTLTDDKLSVLQASGDESELAAIDGASYIGPGEGRYIKDDQGIFVYVGADSGDYQVSFSDVGSGNGAYQYKGSGIFEYVGENEARYDPVVVLPQAQSHNLLDFDLLMQPVSFLKLRGEIAMSGRDENTYSDIDDDDNDGLAQNWSIGLVPEKMRMFGKNLGKMELTGSWRKINNGFSDIDRTTEIEYNRKWDLPDDAQRGEDTRELTGQYIPVTGLAVGGSYGSTRKELFRSERWQAESSLKRKALPEYSVKIEQINTENDNTRQSGDWWRSKGNVSWSLWSIRPFSKYEGEEKRENWSDSLYTGFKFDDVTGGVEFNPFQKLSVMAQMSNRQDSDYDGPGNFEKKSEANTQNYQMRLQNIKSFNASLDFTHRERIYADPQVSNVNTDLAELRMGFHPWKRAISADMNYQISNTATAKKERVYIEVTEGDGNYRFDEDLNEYVSDPLGDHILRILTTDDFLPVVELKSSSRLRFEPRRVFKPASSKKQPFWKRAVSALSSESYVVIDEKSQEEDVWGIYLMDFSKYRQEATTIFGNLQFRQDLYLFENDRDFSLRFRYRSRDEKNNQYLEGGQDRIEQERILRITARLADKWSSQSELSSGQTARIFNFSGRQDRDIYAKSIKTDVSYRPTSPLELALEARFSLEEDRYYDEPTQLQAIALVPRVNYSLRQKGRLTAELEWSNVKAEPEDRVIPYEMASGRSLGQSLRWDMRFDYRISDTIRATFSYSGRNEPERDRTIHTGRAQVTAAFK